MESTTTYTKNQGFVKASGSDRVGIFVKVTLRKAKTMYNPHMYAWSKIFDKKT